MRKIFLFFLLSFLFQISNCYGDYWESSRASISWFVFEGGVEVTSSSTVLITANGVNKEISLHDVCSTGSEKKDRQAERLIRQLLDGNRLEVKVCGKNKEQIDSAVLLVDDVNVNQELISKGYVSTGKQCGTEDTSGKKSNTATSSFQADRSSSFSANSGVNVSNLNSSEKAQVRGYYRKDGTYVQPYKKSETRQYSSDTHRLSPDSGRLKTIDVRGYYRKNGTYVRPHRRSAPRR
ncbi:hypothetical protein [Candidatus Electronema sp. TJ]|uniref:hypothetical protein n=1 Tax=Candidatus Electronema sp. TJ TaxID=3401573 RepID=UPI003AA9A20E